MTASTPVKARAKSGPAHVTSTPVTLRNGLAEVDIQPGDTIPTERVAKAVFVSQALAADWLGRFSDPDRRFIRPAKVADYADKMSNGEWVEMSKNLEFTNDPIVRLSDGHHRLKAIVQSGVGLWFEVHFGADPRSRRIEGVRLSRSPGDMLRMEGCSGYYSETGAGIRNAMLYEQTVGSDIRWRTSLVHIPDAEDVVLYWLDKPTIWSTVVPVAKSLVTSWPVGTAQGALTGFTYLAEVAHPSKGIDFLNLIAGGSGPRDGRGRTVLGIFLQTARVRPVVKQTQRSGTQMEWNRFSMAVLVRAFNAWIAGKATFQRPEWSDKPFILDKIK
jgi:hypothetical protein